MVDRRLNYALIFSFVSAVAVTYIDSSSKPNAQNVSVASVAMDKVSSLIPLNRPSLIAQAAERIPASINEGTLEHNLFCKEKKAADLATEKRHVILEGANCDAVTDVEKVEIKNVTNGSSIAYFPLKKNRFKTDLIFLSPGKNKITIKYKNVKGSFISQDLEITSKN